MKQGQRVMIYQDPATKQKPEGYAILLKRISEMESDPGMQYWLVKFDQDEETEPYHRFISTN